MLPPSLQVHAEPVQSALANVLRGQACQQHTQLQQAQLQLQQHQGLGLPQQPQQPQQPPQSQLPQPMEVADVLQARVATSALPSPLPPPPTSGRASTTPIGKPLIPIPSARSEPHRKRTDNERAKSRGEDLSEAPDHLPKSALPFRIRLLKRMRLGEFDKKEPPADLPALEM